MGSIFHQHQFINQSCSAQYIGQFYRDFIPQFFVHSLNSVSKEYVFENITCLLKFCKQNNLPAGFPQETHNQGLQSAAFRLSKEIESRPGAIFRKKERHFIFLLPPHYSLRKQQKQVAIWTVPGGLIYSDCILHCLVIAEREWAWTDPDTDWQICRILKFDDFLAITSRATS